MESQKWFHPLRQVGGAAQPLAAKLTFINDREGDIFTLWHAVQQAGQHLLTRAKQDRRTRVSASCPHGKLFADMAAQPVRGHFTLDIAADAATGRTARRSVMEVRWVEVELRRPVKAVCEVQTVKLWAVKVEERAGDVPTGQQALSWLLLTTHAITTLAEAVEVVGWYLYRWRIEDAFSALKTRGLKVEASRLHRGRGLMKLCVMSLWAASRLTALVKGRADEITAASEFFSSEELTCLAEVMPRLEGRTAHQRNTHRPYSLAWAVWGVARLGRWHGDGVPGTETIRRGLDKFDGVFLGWEVNRRL